ncbi:MOSC N-terminal beta barrel domain-containing protein [Phenylobacterium sp. LjRoot225]|uniref:MOSC N-terminal beta barrel domain-containing protein n=1 Tax=Phenylobacterium sp. LjRoot225 TaxID=3342285 RepID=UPI003ECF4DF9
MPSKLGEVAQIWRYPIKSLAGERCTIATLDEQGVTGDRIWAIWDQTWNQIASGKQYPDLMRLSGRYCAPDGGFDTVCITDEDGREYRSDDPWACARLSARLGMSVGLRRRPDSGEGEDRPLFRARRPMNAALFLEMLGRKDVADTPVSTTFPGDMDELYKLYLTAPGLFADCSPLHLCLAPVTCGAGRRRSRRSPPIPTQPAPRSAQSGRAISGNRLDRQAGRGRRRSVGDPVRHTAVFDAITRPTRRRAELGGRGRHSQGAWQGPGQDGGGLLLISAGPRGRDRRSP